MKKVLLYVAFAMVVFSSAATAGTIDIISPLVQVNPDEYLKCSVMNLSPSTYNFEVFIGNPLNSPAFNQATGNGGDTVNQYQWSELSLRSPEAPTGLFCVFRVDQTAQVNASLEVHDSTTNAIRSYAIVK